MEVNELYTVACVVFRKCIFVYATFDPERRAQNEYTSRIFFHVALHSLAMPTLSESPGVLLVNLEAALLS